MKMVAKVAKISKKITYAKLARNATTRSFDHFDTPGRTKTQESIVSPRTGFLWVVLVMIDKEG